MTTVYVDRRGAEIAVERGALVVRLPDSRPHSFPLGRVERLVVRAGVRISASALAELWRHDGAVLVLSGRGDEPTARFLARPRRDLARRLRQYELVRDPELRLPFARRLVAAKLAGCARLCRRLAEAEAGSRLRLDEAAARLLELSRHAREAAVLSALLGLEGTGAAVHFAALATVFPPELGFSGRNRRPPRDPANAVLSLGYTLLTFEAARQAVLFGFDPALGALHAPAPGRDSLACDLVEPLRPQVDSLAVDLFLHRRLTARDFGRQGEGVRLSREGRRIFYEAWEARLPALARRLARGFRTFARALEGGVPLAVPVEGGAGDDDDGREEEA